MELIYFSSADDLRGWLEHNHEEAREVWIGIYKSSSRRKGITYQEVVEETACFGWVEGIRKGIDLESYKMRFTPRRKGSIWSLKNIERAERLIREGKMHISGKRAYEDRIEENTERYSYEREDPHLASEFQERFEGDAEAWEFFQTLSPSIQKVSRWWVVKAKRQETRERRFRILLESSRQQRKIPPLQSKKDAP